MDGFGGEVDRVEHHGDGEAVGGGQAGGHLVQPGGGHFPAHPAGRHAGLGTAGGRAVVGVVPVVHAPMRLTAWRPGQAQTRQTGQRQYH